MHGLFIREGKFLIRQIQQKLLISKLKKKNQKLNFLSDPIILIKEIDMGGVVMIETARRAYNYIQILVLFKYCMVNILPKRQASYNINLQFLSDSLRCHRI